MFWLIIACGTPVTQPCEGSVPGHAIAHDAGCLVLPTWEHDEEDPAFTKSMEVSPSSPLDWRAVDDALAKGPVEVTFAPGTYDERLEIDRRDDSEHLLLLEGRAPGSDARASVPGIHTGYDNDVQSHITVRGFEVTGSRDKGVYWRAGDHVILEDLVVHDNKGSPAINLEYSNRSGHRSERFVVRNNHVYDHKGECIYIGGSEGEDEDSHHRVEIVGNLVHDCRNAWDTKHDGINVKDRIGQMWVHRNVVFATDWGIEVASPGEVSHNLVFETDREGFQVSDYFARIEDMVFADNAVISAGHDGIHITADNQAAGDIALVGFNAFGARKAGVLLGADESLHVEMADLVLAGNDVGLDGWGEATTASLKGCVAKGNDVDAAGALDSLSTICKAADLPKEISNPAGADRVFFTEDDPWYVEGHGAKLP